MYEILLVEVCCMNVGVMLYLDVLTERIWFLLFCSSHGLHELESGSYIASLLPIDFHTSKVVITWTMHFVVT